MPSEFPKIKYIQLGKPEINFDHVHDDLQDTYTSRIVSKLMAKVVDSQDKLLCDAIISYAVESGVKDLFLIDEEFIRSAIINGIQRRSNDERKRI